jgi:hypothetical protein
MAQDEVVQVQVVATLRKWAEGADPATDEPDEVIESAHLADIPAAEAAALQEGA